MWKYGFMSYGLPVDTEKFYVQQQVDQNHQSRII